MTSEDVTDAKDKTIRAPPQAAQRAENGEYIFQTFAEVAAFVNALPDNVKVRWQFESASLMATQHYRVTFWRGFKLSK